MTKQLCFLPLMLGLFVSGQATQEVRPLGPGLSVEREIAGGESHTYQIQLAAGQFVRFRLEQRTIDAALILTAPDGKQLAERDLTGAGEELPLSLEVAAAGSYRLTVRGVEAATQHGSYRLEAVVQLKATAQDHKRLTAEALLVEVNELNKQRDKNAPQVIERMQQALLLWRELGERQWTGYALSQMGEAYSNLRQLEKSIEYFEQALPIWRDLKFRAREADTLYGLGFAHSNLSRYEKGLDCFTQALAIYREVQDREWEGRTLIALSNSYNRLGRTEQAIECREQALAIAREVKDRLGEEGALISLGTSYYRLGRTEKAIEAYEQGLAIAREIKDRRNENTALGNLAGAYHRLGRSEKAIEYFEQALAISREIKDRQGEAWVLNNLGVVYGTLSRYEKALEYFEQALAIFREVQDREREGNALNRLGGSYSTLGRSEKAIEYYERARILFREHKIRRGEGDALENLGSEYSTLGRHEKAIEYLEQALAIHREVKDRVPEGVTLEYLGLEFAALGRTEKAIEYYEQALAIAREVKNPHAEQSALNQLGTASRSFRRVDEAVSYHEQALLIARDLKAQKREANYLSELARDERDRGNLARARALIEESLAIAESVRTGVVGKEDRAGFLATVQSSYQLYTDLLMRQHQAEPTKSFDALAVEVSERQRARSLLDLLAEARADLRQGVDAALLERERLLGRQLNAKAQLLTEANRPAQAAALRQEISQLENDYERAQAVIRKSSPHYAALTQPRPLKLKEIQAQLDADTLLLEYALGEERSYLWAITKDALASYELPKQEVIDQRARQVYELLQARSTVKRRETVPQQRQRIAQADTQLAGAAQALSQLVLAPAAAELGNKRLVIVADGALQYVPFAMLPEPKDEGGRMKDEAGKGRNPHPSSFILPPLIVSHEVVSLPSASALAIQRSELAGRPSAPKLLAVIADPVFERSDARLGAVVTAPNDNAPTQTRSFDDERSIAHLAEKKEDQASATTRKLVIPRLPFTQQEATRLLALAPKDATFGALGLQANRATVLSPELSQYRYVHFATHGVLDSERPGLSSLLLSMVDEKGKPQDGFLRANDIYNLKLPAELVVLSACQTGLGKDVRGEGLVGLTRGFMYAGAARVVVSLWNVNDQATAELMTKFYQRMLKQRERPAAALRAAQVELWKQRQWNAPFYWAAFTLQGEWR